MYNVEFTRNALKSLEKIDRKYQSLIIEKIEILSLDPSKSNNVKALKGMDGCYRLRVAQYRVIYELQNELMTILVIDINHRKDIYR